MTNKGQKFQHYPESVKREAIRLHLEEKWTYREITEHLGIHDKDRVKRWMRKYREEVSVYSRIAGEIHFGKQPKNIDI